MKHEAVTGYPLVYYGQLAFMFEGEDAILVDYQGYHKQVFDMTMFNPPHPGSMAIRLEAWMNGPTAESWVRMQAEYDLWQARQKP